MSTWEAIEHKLGKRIDPKARGSVAHLNQVPDWMVAQIRQLDSVLMAKDLLRYYITPENHPYLNSYIQQVIFEGAPSLTWRRGRTIVPSLSLQDQLCMTRSEILAPLGGHFRVRTVPRLVDWESGVAWVGAPAQREPDADYRTPSPPKTASLANTIPVEPVVDETIAIRRWIAGRLAVVLRASGRLESVRTLQELASGLPALQNWTADSQIAAGALLRQIHEPESGRGIPGFGGGDDWYQDETHSLGISETR